MEELEQSNKLLKEHAQQLQTTLELLTKEKQQAEKRSSVKLNKVQHDFEEERLMNEQLRQNQNYFQSEMQKLKDEFENTMKAKSQVKKQKIFKLNRQKISLNSIGNR